jgi:epoxyqueuosine reductase
VPLAPDGPVADHCGSCTRCIDACPTDAIYQPYALDATRCISYLTIEDRDRDVPAPLKPDLDGWVFGCDVCQDVCPWNTFSRPTPEPAYAPREGAVDTPLREWVELRLDEFEERFKNSPVARATHEGFVRNARANLEGLGVAR